MKKKSKYTKKNKPNNEKRCRDCNIVVPGSTLSSVLCDSCYSADKIRSDRKGCFVTIIIASLVVWGGVSFVTWLDDLHLLKTDMTYIIAGILALIGGVLVGAGMLLRDEMDEGMTEFLIAIGGGLISFAGIMSIKGLF